jgi:hypothetical protein
MKNWLLAYFTNTCDYETRQFLINSIVKAGIWIHVRGLQ